MIRTQVRLRETQYRALKELAARRHTSVAELIRQAVDRLLETSGTVPPEERYRRALSIIGAFRSGQSDISTHHDEYLDEVYGQWSSS